MIRRRRKPAGRADRSGKALRSLPPRTVRSSVLDVDSEPDAGFDSGSPSESKSSIGTPVWFSSSSVDPETATPSRWTRGSVRVRPTARSGIRPETVSVCLPKAGSSISNVTRSLRRLACGGRDHRTTRSTPPTVSVTLSIAN